MRHLDEEGRWVTGVWRSGLVSQGGSRQMSFHDFDHFYGDFVFSGASRIVAIKKLYKNDD